MARTLTLLALIMSLFASSAFADGSVGDIKIDIDSSSKAESDASATATGGAATITGSGNSTIKGSGNSSVKGSGNSQATIRGNLLTVGFNGFIAPGIAEKGEWKLLCSEMYMDWSPKDVENARYHKGFVDFITFNWGSNYEFVPMRAPLKANDNPISCLNYWPGWESRAGDRPLGAVDIEGKVGTPDAAFVAQAYDVCKKKTGASWVAVIKEEASENVTVGASFNLSGAVSRITGDGNSGNAAATGIGFGKARVRKEGYINAKALCMNDLPPVQSAAPASPAPPAKKELCSQEEIAMILKGIHDLELKIYGNPKTNDEGCPAWSKENRDMRIELGKRNMDAYACTKEVRFLHAAIYNFEAAERNHYFSGAYKDHRYDSYVTKNLESLLKTCIYVRDGSAEKFLTQTWVYEKKWVEKKKQNSVHEKILEMRRRVDVFSLTIEP